MWILPSLGRPHNAKRFLNAYIETDATTPVLLRINENDGGYEDIQYQNWIVEVGPRLPLSYIYNSIYQRYRCDWYGFVADDVVPKTHKWDTRLIEVAGTDSMAVPNGGHEPNGTPHFVLGGDLVRSIGWLSLPGLNRLYIDTVWADIASARGVLRRVPEVVLEHLHFSNGKALMDSTYRKPKKAEDKIIYENWKHNWRNAC